MAHKVTYFECEHCGVFSDDENEIIEHEENCEQNPNLSGIENTKDDDDEEGEDYEQESFELLQEKDLEETPSHNPQIY